MSGRGGRHRGEGGRRGGDGGRGRGRGRGGPSSGQGRGRGRGEGRGQGRGRGEGRGGGGRGRGQGDGRPIPTQEALTRQADIMRGLALSRESSGSAGGEIVLRPGFGKAGREITMESNFFPLTCGADVAHHYDVEITSLKFDRGTQSLIPSESKTGPDRANCDAIIRELEKQKLFTKGYAYDGWKNLETPVPIPPKHLKKEMDIVIEDAHSGRQRTFKVKLQHAADNDIGSLQEFCKGNPPPHFNLQDALRVLDMVTKQAYASTPGATFVGSRIFFGDNPIPASSLIEIWRGVMPSVRACQGGLFLNLDEGAAAFKARSPVIEIVKDVCRLRNNNELKGLPLKHKDGKWTRLQSAIKGLTVEVTHLKYKRQYKVTKGLGKPPGQATFEIDGKQSNVKDYFKSQHNITLQFPNLPVLDCTRKKDKKVCYVPMELCRVVTKMERAKKLDRRTAMTLSTAAVIPPDERKNSINHRIESMDSKVLEQFGLKVAKKMTKVKGRILPPPFIQYEQHCVDVGTNGAWNLLKSKFLKCKDLKSWAVVSLGMEDQWHGYDAFIDHLVKKYKALGGDIGYPPPFVSRRNLPVLELMKQGCRAAQDAFQHPPQLVMFILDSNPDSQYAEAKYASDVDIGIPSQCIVARNAKLAEHDARGRDQYCSNLCMKINTKIGGTNCRLGGSRELALPLVGEKNERCMFLGADVTHPRTGNKEEPSVAAVVGSVDGFVSQFSTRNIRLGHGEEVIHLLGGALEELLHEFGQRNQCLPTTLVFYRDGIADNQFAECKDVEIKQIFEACETVKSGYKPKLAFIVAKKRHNTRFFPMDGNRDHRSGNILPGTLVEREICHPVEFDFYLNSHAGIKGTSKPVHYFVLHDDVGLGPDGLQLLTYNLCYIYCRCTRSVSYPAPAYYAHQAAARAKLLIEPEITETDSQSGDDVPPVGVLNIHKNLQSTMYFV